MFDPQRGFVDPLLSWYEQNGRHDLPWREPDRTPFEVLLAEIMLQRTTAEAVAGVFRPFAARYPTPAAAAAAPSDDIKGLVEPLGLVKRAAYVRQCAGQILSRHAGDVPREHSVLVDLHGVGEYTARSVLIHVHGLGVAAVDTNVRRLLSRFFDVTPEQSQIAVLADALAPSTRSSDFQHAMLDFAAEVCTADSPGCSSCPLRGPCATAEE
ncbi:A/G-specific adenine glycosylase [Halorubrum californiense DSM 19288]|uniref:A/G-specific adenine glycosylase n=1 Tax=Halorubrum californiense DSM 19288 TaxID=1227465 RepID=M0E7Q8_9EURY|nr:MULTISPECIES: A/G-specific adenine glycosylase [Halorubrum]ELZ42952.1 A/G-specific adenine glycosylase [Halorubrum californiense DSM 19288]TKX68814.1 A/G-specific adenine glycosylase [Halorubrum sp. GN11GM_10-3_MGM]